MAIERERMQRCLSELPVNLDEQRLEQEMVIWAQRADVTEELQRLNAHLQEVEHVLQKGGVVGRRLDFIMQELNREANTLSSKSFHAAMTQSAIEIKVLIEQRIADASIIPEGVGRQFENIKPMHKEKNITFGDLHELDGEIIYFKNKK